MKPCSLCCCLLLFLLQLHAQPGTVSMTPQGSLSLSPVTIAVPAKFGVKFPQGRRLNLPPGFKANVFYVGGLLKPRFMAFDPQGVLHVSDMSDGGLGEIYAFPDKDHDGVADTAIVAAFGFSNNHDVKFYKGDMYVAETYKIWKCSDLDHDGIYEQKTLFIDTLGIGGATGGHYTRTLQFDSANHRLFVSIGSSANIARDGMKRAIIEVYNDDGTGKRVWSYGVRNAIGMTLHPATNRLWAGNNGSDRQGDDIPPEWVDLVRDGGFYGYPFAYGNQVWFDTGPGADADYQKLNPLTATDSAQVAAMIEPAALIQAHSAPMALQFLNTTFPSAMKHGCLMALRGSWNRTYFTGHKVVYLDLDNDQDTSVNFVADFCTGFLVDTHQVSGARWGRPVGLALDANGTVYLTSDEFSKVVLAIIH